MAVHIESLEICSYRGVKELKIEDLGDVNIFVGDNNTGKTSVLESIQILCEPTKSNLLQMARQREKYKTRIGIGFVDSIRYLFDINDSAQEHYEMTISGKIHGQDIAVNIWGEILTQLMDVNALRNRYHNIKNPLPENMEEVETFYGKIECTIDESTSFSFLQNTFDEFEINNYSSMIMRSENNDKFLKSRAILTVDHVLENAFNALIKDSKTKERAVRLLKEEFDEEIADLRIINLSNGARFTPIVEHEDGKYVPLSLYGDGMKKALTMLNAIVNTEDGVVLIDEFETALHTSAMKKVFSFLMESAYKSRIQLFLTTHSLEALDKMLESAGDYAENIRVIRLKKKNGKTYSRITNGKDALLNRKEYNLEYRV